MLPSKKFLSLPIISLKEGQQIGFVRNVVIDPKTRALAALIVDPKRFFKEQRIIPFNRVVSIGENAITVSTASQAEKAANLPDILHLIKEKTAVIGIKVLTADGKTLGIVNEFYINKEDGSIASFDVSSGKIEGLFYGKARLKADEILTMGSDVLVASEGCEEKLEVFSKGIKGNFKSFFQIASSKATQRGQRINTYWESKRKQKIENLEIQEVIEEQSYPASNISGEKDNDLKPDFISNELEENHETKNGRI